MGKSRSLGWIAGTAVLVVLILVGTYFLLYQKRAEATEQTLLEVEAARSQNDLLEIQVAQLAADAEKMPEYEAALEALGLQIPAEPMLPEITDLISSVATQTTVTVMQISPSGAVNVVPPAQPTVAAPPTPTDGTTGEGATDGSTAIDEAEETADEAEAAADAQDDTEPPAPTTPVGPPTIEGFVAIPIMVKVFGSYANTVAFLDILQRREDRLFLASDLDMKRIKTSPASMGRPAAVDGDVELQINGYFYVLLEPVVPEVPAEPVEGEEPGEGEEPLPFPPGDPRNPYVPLVPTQVG